VLKGPARLSGANRVPIGHSKSHHHRNSVFSRRSAFDRLQWPERRHHSSQDHQKDLFRASVMNMGQKRDQRPSQISNSKLLKKGKRPIIEPERLADARYFKCLGLSKPLCKAWMVCFSCNQKGHVARHCLAQWRKIGLSHPGPKTECCIWIAKSTQARGRQVVSNLFSKV
jgi:hypothetical protein